jgi:lysophospholipid acyltransferase (LPLAT)-like uncharacterized protein
VTTVSFSYGQRFTLAIVPPVVAWLLRLLNRTLRYETIDLSIQPSIPPAVQVWCFWHRCLIPCACYFHDKTKPAVLISQSFDGELIARTIERLGFLSARGSSSRGGGSGLWSLAKALEGGYPAVFTADGPRGPVYRVKPGVVKLAQATGYPIGTFYLHPEKAWVLRSWDRFLIPKPFSRVAVSWGRNIEAPQSDDPVVMEAKRLEVEAALEGTRLEAERHFDQAMNMQSP